MTQESIYKEIEQIEGDQMSACLSPNYSTNYILLLNLRKEYLIAQLYYVKEKPYIDKAVVVAAVLIVCAIAITFIKICLI